MDRVADELRKEICIVANVGQPEWLRKRRNVAWLQECLRLVKAGVVVITPTGPDFSRSAQASELVRYAQDIASLFSE
jgi:hypothetical protein